jgi:hypothetical protein
MQGPTSSTHGPTQAVTGGAEGDAQIIRQLWERNQAAKRSRKEAREKAEREAARPEDVSEATEVFREAKETLRGD